MASEASASRPCSAKKRRNRSRFWRKISRRSAAWASSLHAAAAAGPTNSGDPRPGWLRSARKVATRSASPARKPVRYPVMPLRFEQEWIATTFSCCTSSIEAGGSPK